jgi:hypothetical protein
MSGHHRDQAVLPTGSDTTGAPVSVRTKSRKESNRSWALEGSADVSATTATTTAAHVKRTNARYPQKLQIAPSFTQFPLAPGVGWDMTPHHERR